ncbi:MAG: hypothetical protein GY868_09190, partial [Deltaproteobacteria bacterium]|nr:hypothetical protein [Deltaproteobacteria bacterium]
LQPEPAAGELTFDEPLSLDDSAAAMPAEEDVLSLDPEPEPAPGDADIVLTPSFETSLPDSAGDNAPELDDLDRIPTLQLEEEDGRPAGAEAGTVEAGFKIVACGQPKKVSDTAIKIPLIFTIESLEKECMVNLSISFGDFKLK